MMAPPLLAALILSLPGALSAGLDTDIELLRPVFSYDSLPGVESALPLARGSLSFGALYHIAQDPLLLYTYGVENGSAIGHRSTLDLGLSWSFANRLSTRLMLPLVAQTPGDIPSLSAPGVGLSDPELGLRADLFSAGPVSAAFKADLLLPFGRTQAWTSSGQLRPRLGGALSFGRTDLRLLLDGAWLGQTSTAVDETDLGSSLLLGAGLLWNTWPEHVELWSSLIHRAELSELGQGGPGTASEWLSGLRLRQGESLCWNLGVGKGLTEGMGTPGLRAFAGLSWSHRPRPERPGFVIIDRETIVDTVVPDQRPPPKEKPWADGELSRIEGSTIAIRDPIHFEFGTEKILPESRPVLEAVARLMNGSWQIAHVVIVGHTSEEGTYAYNLDLSLRRAQTVLIELVESGVDPSRLSIRGMGEVDVPSAPGAIADPDSQRRVVFRITEFLDPESRPPRYATETVLPWSGEKKSLVKPGDLLLPKKDQEPRRGASGRKAKDKEVSEDFFKEPLPELDPAPEELPEQDADPEKEEAP